MKKRGFTLIELLAVIVILAIIALIATPAVLNIIEDSRKGAAEASARNIINSAKTYYMSETMNGRTPGSIDLSTNTLKYDGDQATKGTITFTDGKALGKMYVGGYCVEVAVDGKVESEKMGEDECEITLTTTPEVTSNKYADGTPLLYDPVRNVKCSDAEVETNVNNYKSSHIDPMWEPTITGLKEGCMKWYVFLDSEESNTVNLLLDHDIARKMYWNTDGSKTTPDTIEAQLQTDVSTWTGEAKSSARLISASEINQIAPLIPFSKQTYDPNLGESVTINIENWSQTDLKTWYYLHTGNQTEYQGIVGSNKYAWLFDNTNGCEAYGCNTHDGSTYGYWTSTYAGNGVAWSVSVDGDLNQEISYDDNRGLRPVITISKSIFK